MFTASHNPPEYLGIKFIPDYAGPATSDITDELMKNLDMPFEIQGHGAVAKYDFSSDVSFFLFLLHPVNPNLLILKRLKN